MKKILNTVIVCALVVFFLSASDVFAVDTTNLNGREYKISGVTTRYTAEPVAYDGSSQITQGMLYFNPPAGGIEVVHNIASDLFASLLGGLPEMYAYITLGAYTTGANKVTSYECDVTIYDTAMVDVVASVTGPCTAEIKFDSKKAFTAKITLPHLWGEGSLYVLTFTGKYMGKWPTD